MQQGQPSIGIPVLAGATGEDELRGAPVGVRVGRALRVGRLLAVAEEHFCLLVVLFHESPSRKRRRAPQQLRRRGGRGTLQSRLDFPMGPAIIPR